MCLSVEYIVTGKHTILNVTTETEENVMFLLSTIRFNMCYIRGLWFLVSLKLMSMLYVHRFTGSADAEVEKILLPYPSTKLIPSYILSNGRSASCNLGLL